MKAKDTVMSDREIEDRLDYLATNSHDVNGNYIPKCKVVDKLYGESTMATPFEAAKHIAKAQAEISFKAGIREVVAWITPMGYRVTQTIRGDALSDLNDTTARADMFKFSVLPSAWQAKLKEWGIELKN